MYYPPLFFLYALNTIAFLALQLKFEEDLKITEMYSGEGEAVPFKKDIYPRGNVEDWLLEVENVMKESLRQIMGEALIDYALPEVSRQKEERGCTQNKCRYLTGDLRG